MALLFKERLLEIDRVEAVTVLAFDPYTSDSAFHLKVDPAFGCVEVRGDVFFVLTDVVAVYLN